MNQPWVFRREGIPTAAGAQTPVGRNIRLSSHGWPQEDTYSVIPLVGGTWSSQTLREVNRAVTARGWGKWEWAVGVLGLRVSVCKDKKALETDGGDDCITV